MLQANVRFSAILAVFLCVKYMQRRKSSISNYQFLGEVSMSTMLQLEMANFNDFYAQI